jgi:hypothetical protein
MALELASKMVHTGDTVVQATSDSADLATYAVMQQNGHLDLLVINKSPAGPINERFNIDGFTPSSGATAWQYGEAEDTAQSQSADGAASLTASQPALKLTVDTTGQGTSAFFNMTFPAYSMTVLDLAPAPTTPLSLVMNTQPPASVVAGSTFPVAVGVEDPTTGNEITDFNGPVTVALSGGPAGAVLGGTLTETAVNGVATFPDLAVSQPGTAYTLQFTAPGLNGTHTDPFTVTPAVTQDGLRVTAISPSTDFVTSLPSNQVVVTFNHKLAGLTPDDPTGLGFTNNPFAIMLIPSGPDGGALFSAHAGSLWTAPSGIDSGDLPVPATLVYHENADGTSTITLTPNQPLATDIYLVSIGGLTDLAGDPVADSDGNVGTVYASFDLRPTPFSLAPLQITSISTQDGTVTIQGNTIAQPDTIGIAFNKPLDSWTVNSGTVHLRAQTGAGQSQPVAASVAYSPTTDTVYLTPEATLVPGVTYVVQVDPGVTDDQGFPNPGVALGQTFSTTFQVSAAGAGGGAAASPFKVAATSPADGTMWTAPLGYGAVTFSKPVDMTSLGRFSAMLVPQTGGVTTGGSGYGDVPLNAKVAFNPNTSQLIIVPTGSMPNNTVYLLALSGIKATDGSSLAGGTEYATFLWNAGATAHLAARASRSAPMDVTPVIVTPAAGTTRASQPLTVVVPRRPTSALPAVRPVQRVPAGPLTFRDMLQDQL